MEPEFPTFDPSSVQCGKEEQTLGQSGEMYCRGHPCSEPLILGAIIAVLLIICIPCCCCKCGSSETDEEAAERAAAADEPHTGPPAFAYRDFKL